jgi:hypothetical protein
MRFLLTFVSSMILTVSRAYTAKVLWYWFAVPLGVPPIGFWHAMGLGSLVFVFSASLVKPHKAAGEKKSTKDLVAEFLAYALLLPSLLLGLGWFYLQAMR